MKLNGQLQAVQCPFLAYLLICPYAIFHVSSLVKYLLKCFAYYYYFKNRVDVVILRSMPALFMIINEVPGLSVVPGIQSALNKCLKMENVE